MSRSSTPERRSSTPSSGPPTMLMQSYQDMGQENRRFMRGIGLGLIAFTVVVPMIGQIALLALGRQGISGFFWTFSGVGFVVGLVFVWPQLGVWAAGAIPAGVAKMLPSRIFGRADRRGARLPTEVDER